MKKQDKNAWTLDMREIASDPELERLAKACDTPKGACAATLRVCGWDERDGLWKAPSELFGVKLQPEPFDKSEFSESDLWHKLHPAMALNTLMMRMVSKIIKVRHAKQQEDLASALKYILDEAGGVMSAAGALLHLLGWEAINKKDEKPAWKIPDPDKLPDGIELRMLSAGTTAVPTEVAMQISTSIVNIMINALAQREPMHEPELRGGSKPH